MTTAFDLIIQVPFLSTLVMGSFFGSRWGEVFKLPADQTHPSKDSSSSQIITALCTCKHKETSLGG